MAGVDSDVTRTPTAIQPAAEAPAGPATRSEQEAPNPRVYFPALDGIRALAVILVFAFHAGFGWAEGGFLGVSVFFTLSGFLITRLLLDDGVRRRTIGLARFWTRRLRRLLPAALVAIVLGVVVGVTVLDGSPDSLRGDALAAVGYVANWRFLFSGHSYADLFQAPSPLQHFWSLAIEEQFYLVYPLVAVVVLRHSGGGRAFCRSLARTLAVGIVLSVCITLVAASFGAFDFVYYSLPTRAGELLVGGLLACSGIPRRLIGTRARPPLVVLGWLALFVIVALSATTQLGGWLSYGGLTAFAFVSAALIAAALARGGVATVLSWAPLRGLGRISYGVYLFHWPIILWLDAELVGLHGLALAGVQATVTILVATASYFLIEQPIRRGVWPTGRVAWVMGPSAVAAVVVAAVSLGALAPEPTATDFAASQRVVDAAASRAPAPAGSGSGTAADPFRIGFFGDSTALRTAVGIAQWTDSNPGLAVVAGDTGLGCSLTRGGDVRSHGVVDIAGRDCPDWATLWPKMLDEGTPDAAVVMFGPFDVADRRLPGDDQWRAPGDPVYDAFLEREMLEAVDLFLARGVTPVWLTSPRIDVDRSIRPAPAEPDPASDPARMARFNEIVRDVQRQRPELRVIDLATWLRDRPEGELDPVLRPDGVHFTIDSSRVVAAWLAPKIISELRARR